MNRWVFTFEELLDFKKQNFNDYTLFLKSKLGKRHDGSYICGTWVLSPREIDLIEIKNNIYADCLYLITSIDVENHYIDFNLIGTKEDLLKLLESQV